MIYVLCTNQCTIVLCCHFLNFFFIGCFSHFQVSVVGWELCNWCHMWYIYFVPLIVTFLWVMFSKRRYSTTHICPNIHMEEKYTIRDEITLPFNIGYSGSCRASSLLPATGNTASCSHQRLSRAQSNVLSLEDWSTIMIQLWVFSIWYPSLLKWKFGACSYIHLSTQTEYTA